MSRAHIREAQQLAHGALVELFSLDTTMLTNIYGQPGTGTVYNWCPGTVGGAAVKFAGVVYAPMPIAATGFEYSGQGKLPKPKLQISNINGLATGLVIAFGDMLGAIVTRQRTFEQFLDGQPQADSSAVFDPDVFRVDRKSHQGKAYIEFELAAAFDQQGLRLPRRQVLRDACYETYRVFSGGTWHPGTCPYAGAAMFDIGDAPVATPDKDVCSHRLTGCLARFGKTAPLPFGGFPGVAQTVT